MSAMELDDILNLDRLICTGDQARAGWYLDQDAILEAIDKLGITGQVRIRYMTGRYTYGTHRNQHDGVHRITVDQNRELRSASHTLWHELVHCMQSERWLLEDLRRKIQNWHYDDYKAVDGDWGNRYRGNAYEIEANRIAYENADFELMVFGT